MRNTKKGFTLVELLVVIAILAILATVSVVGYTSFIKRANVSNDQAMIGMINNNLQAAYVTGNPATAGDAITTLAGLGFYGDKFNAYTEGYHYAYSLTNNKFYLLDDENNVVYPDEDVELSSLWALYGDADLYYIDGITKYVATTTLQNKTDFDKVFTGSGYEIDLNNNVMMIDAGNKSSVTISNGSTTVSGYAESSTATVMRVLNAQDIMYEGGCYYLRDGVIENVVIPKVIEITIGIDTHTVGTLLIRGNTVLRNCVIQHKITGDHGDGIKNNWTIENCVFTGLTGKGCDYHIQVSASNGSVTISGNTFVNCSRAIIVTRESGNSLQLDNVTITIENNTFNLLSDEEDNSAVRVNDLTSPTNLSLIVKNNTMNSGDMLLRGSDDDVANITHSGNVLAEGIDTSHK